MMKIVFGILLVAGCAAFAESTNDIYIERYPGDGMGQRSRKVPAKKAGDTFLQNLLPEKGQSSLAPEEPQPSSTNTATRAARYISPRVGSKEFAPSRLAEPKMKTVALSNRAVKILPSPKVSDKIGAPFPVSTNAPPSSQGPEP